MELILGTSPAAPYMPAVPSLENYNTAEENQDEQKNSNNNGFYAIARQVSFDAALWAMRRGNLDSYPPHCELFRSLYPDSTY